MSQLLKLKESFPRGSISIAVSQMPAYIVRPGRNATSEGHPMMEIAVFWAHGESGQPVHGGPSWLDQW